MASERRPLIDGLNEPAPAVSADQAKDFIYRTKPKPPTTRAERVMRLNWTIRMREDFVRALKQASLKRQLDGVEPSTVQDMIEQAVEPWLRDHGYLP